MPSCVGIGTVMFVLTASNPGLSVGLEVVDPGVDDCCRRWDLH